MSGPKDKQQAKDQEQFQQDMADLELREDIMWFMSDKRGRRFIARFLKTNGEDITNFDTSFTGNSTTFELEGRRKAAKHLQALLIYFAPRLFLLLLQENFINLETEQ